MDEIECAVIGAGVVGLAVARALAMAGRETIIVEKESLIGSETSSRNSEVIHAGIYYPAGSLKARLCVEGRNQLYAYCESRNVAHKKCGKLIVAPRAAQRGELEKIAAAAARNGVDDVSWLDRDAALKLEPELRCEGALLSPSTGIIDSHGLMLAYLGDAEAHGAALALGARVSALHGDGRGVVLAFGDDDAPSLRARLIVNCAGLSAPALATAAGVQAPRAYYAKGSYYALAGRSPFSRLIYPTPEPGGLGVHITLDLAGQARFGPDVEWIDELDYDVDPARAEKFYAAVRAYWPGLRDGQLTPAYAGIRPKIAGPGEPNADFAIAPPEPNGPPLINLFGIESPGLTASLAIAAEVERIAKEVLDA
ncbi:MAG: NAD(P)/FAD-dependent oxidoreductase [Caulobacterales bacterium]|jgi:L-2-hydroxyglutarate oxidase LhgO|nr:NAD(P)/FAD-dependent oxidoreductase [Caulobacterales bacterium]